MNHSLNADQDMKDLYRSFRDKFLNITAHYGLPKEELIDIYQDAFIAYYEAIKYKKIKIDKSPESYLMGTAKNMIFTRIKKKIKEREMQQDVNLGQDDILEYQRIELSPVQEKLYAALEKLSESCRKILTLFYFRQYSIEAIMHSMNYNSENVTKSHKSRCLKHLKSSIQDSPNS